MAAAKGERGLQVITSAISFEPSSFPLPEIYVLLAYTFGGIFYHPPLPVRTSYLSTYMEASKEKRAVFRDGGWARA